jgi:spermidine synthase
MKLKRKPATHRKKKGTEVSAVPGDDGLTLKLATIYFVSGIPALIYQTVWQRLLVLHSGVGTTSVAIIVAAYMLGIGLGSMIGGRVSRVVTPAQALAGFAVLEVLMSLCAISSRFVLYDLLYQRFGWLYSELWLACILHIATLLLPTSMMGATLPLMTRALVTDAQSAPHSVSLLYGFNTLGAACGAMLGPWCLLPYVGVVGALSVGAALNFSIAMSALFIRSRLANHAVRRQATDVDRTPQSVTSSPSFGTWMTLYFVGGLCAIGLEIIWFRILDVAVKSTSFTFGTVLGTYLACMAIGSIAGARHVERIAQPLRVFLWTQIVILVAAAAAVLIMVYYPTSWFGSGWLIHFWGSYNGVFPSAEKLGPTLILYFGLPLFLMGPATFLMGYSFSVLQRGVQRDALTSGYRVGLLQAANIAGCTVGSLLVGLWLLAAIGTLNTLRVMVAIGSTFAVVGIFATPWRKQFVGGLVGLAAFAGLIPEANHLWRRLHGDADPRSFIAEDITGIAALTPEPDGVQWRMSASGKGQSYLPFGGVHSKLGALPVTLHPNPKSLAIIGLGSADTAWAAACRPETSSITVFEICTPEETVLRSLAARGGFPQLQQFLADPRIRFDGRDGRHSLMTETVTYDLIEADAIRPNGSYAGYLYSIEFFQLCAKRLKSGGMMCAWSPTPRTHVTFRQVFPHVIELDQNTVLIGSAQPIELNLDEWRARIRSTAVADYLGPTVVEQCLGSIVHAQVLPPPGDVPTEWINTDLFPFDEFQK